MPWFPMVFTPCRPGEQDLVYQGWDPSTNCENHTLKVPDSLIAGSWRKGYCRDHIEFLKPQNAFFGLQIK